MQTDCGLHRTHAESNDKKDVTFFANLFYPDIKQLGSEFVDLMIFDGAKNVQKDPTRNGSGRKLVRAVLGVTPELVWAETSRAGLARLFIEETDI